MAAGRFIWFATGLKYTLEARINWAGGAANGSAATPIVAIPMRDTISPLTGSHSALAQVIAHRATASSTVVNAIALSSAAVTQSGADTVKVDYANIAGFSSDGSTIPSFKYTYFYAQSASNGAGVDNLLVGYVDMDTDSASASAGNAVQVNLNLASAGLAKIRANP